MLIKSLFYIFAAILVLAAGRVITVRNSIHAVLYLVLTFFACAGLWMLLEAEFLAIVLVLVYVGAVMVLFLFVVMMLDVNIAPRQEGFIRYLPVGIGIASLILIEIGMVLWASDFGLDELPKPAAAAVDFSNTEALGAVLYTVYVYPFEIAAAILLVAIIAAIALTMRRRSGLKHPRAELQVQVQRSQRVRLISMPAESKESEAGQ